MAQTQTELKDKAQSPVSYIPFYGREQRCLKFGDFVPTGQAERVFTCRSSDIVSPEAAHAVLDGLKPDWLLAHNPPQTGALHEAFGDLTAIFLSLWQLD